MRVGGALVAVLVMACGAATRPNDPPSCGDRPELEGVCIGVSESAICSSTTCTDGVACSWTYAPTNDADLRLAALDAQPGECIAAPAGDWGELQLKGGVSLLGRRAREVSFASLVITHSTSARSVVRGLSVVNGSISATGPGVTEIDRVLVEGGRGVAISAREGSVVVRESTIHRGLGGGIFVGCASECRPGSRPTLTVRATWIRDVGLVAIALRAIDGDLRDVVVDGAHSVDFQFGRGLELAEHSTVQAQFLHIKRADDVAVFVIESAGSLGPGVEVRDSGRGVHLLAIPEGGFALDGFKIVNVGAAAVTMGKGSRAIALRNGLIDATTMRELPRDVGGIVQIGDGVVWSLNVQANVASTVTIAGSARVPAMIEASATGTFAAKLTGGDANKGIVVTHADGPTDHPALKIEGGTKVVYAEEFPSAER